MGLVGDACGLAIAVAPADVQRCRRTDEAAYSASPVNLGDRKPEHGPEPHPDHTHLANPAAAGASSSAGSADLQLFYDEPQNDNCWMGMAAALRDAATPA